MTTAFTGRSLNAARPADLHRQQLRAPRAALLRDGSLLWAAHPGSEGGTTPLFHSALLRPDKKVLDMQFA